MSYSMATTVVGQLAGEGCILAKLVDGDLYIYPEGLGTGPVLIMGIAEWRRLNHEVRMAMMRAEQS